MAELDPSNPLAVIVGFFGILLTGLFLFIKFSLSFGIVGGALAGLGLFAKIFWGDNK